MSEGVITGAFAQVVGTFDLVAKSGTIDYVTPVRIATESADVEDEGIHLVGEDAAKQKLFDKIVNPQRNSCSPHAQKGTYEEFVPVSANLQRIELSINGAVVAEFTRGSATPSGGVAFGAASADAPHRVPLTTAAAAAPVRGVTYSVQAKPEGDAAWQTLAVGLPTPSTEIDVNQFPGRKKHLRPRLPLRRIFREPGMTKMRVNFPYLKYGAAREEAHKDEPNQHCPGTGVSGEVLKNRS
jgi:hypothetical protein